MSNINLFNQYITVREANGSEWREYTALVTDPDLTLVPSVPGDGVPHHLCIRGRRVVGWNRGTDRPVLSDHDSQLRADRIVGIAKQEQCSGCLTRRPLVGLSQKRTEITTPYGCEIRGAWFCDDNCVRTYIVREATRYDGERSITVNDFTPTPTS